MRQRIDHLEGLVTRMITQHQQGPSSPQKVVLTPESPRADAGGSIPTVAADGPGAGTTLIDGVHSVYRAGEDWYDVLQEINELKKTWNDTQDDQTDDHVRPTQSHTVDGSSLLFGHVKPIERIEILATLPPKAKVDGLISHFFNRPTFPISVPPILHEPTFLREYDEHWKDPSRTSPIWLGLLFSILGITMLAYHQYGEPPEYEGISECLFQLYRIRTAQCLLSGDIAKCLPYTVETLRFNATAELNRRDDNRRGLWIMTGVVVRAAINMGYHRDSAQSPSITPLQAECRRRIWISVISMDDMASFLGGFPRMSSGIFSDTLEPRNLHDWELSEDTTVLPPSRPLTEPTQTTYLIVKGRLFRALGRVADLNSTPTPPSYNTVLEVDRAVYDAYENFPPHMKLQTRYPRPDPPRNISFFAVLSLASMYHKGMCTLHRKYMAKERLRRQYKFSQDRCIASALAIVDNQRMLDLPWYKSAQIRQMLTLAAMILFLELELRQRIPVPDVSPDSGTVVQSLKTACGLWGDAKSTCEEAERVCNTLSSMLSSIQKASGAGTSQTITPQSLELPGLTPQILSLDGDLSFEKDLSNMDIDWATWDSFIEDANFDQGPVY
ncbi:hypothetical protein BO71DRAFT_419302 [Aspergillus ellipticus CBS 707.79]|uniref:Xylanolytic transcriptional activator regulatory domain-containing protein n=1 Tax=Aspergillus ellipticus CBS 707.79 TaxID=1448320 RepID=A0A319DBC4_9EURO|nr:hypothetical protein BO71DRAFT_419302 [Aspergillus ellipticus CBS 707.79]